MHRPDRSFALPALLVLTLAAGLLGGCSRTIGPAPVASAPVASAPDTSIADLTQMTPAEKTSQIAANFPVQVPVAAGAVVRAEAQGDGAWVYQIVVPGSPASVRNWYVEMYRNASWTMTGGGASEAMLQKGGAQTRLQFEAADSGGVTQTQVTASVGVGTPVLQTQ